jgi:hypothetical protein
MRDRLLETFSREYEAYIRRLFEAAPRIPNTGLAETPIIGGQFFTWADHTHLLLKVCRALCAREQVHHDAPGWPALPLHVQEIAAMEAADCPRCGVLGLYAGSLKEMGWNYDEHPHFPAFVGGLLAYDCTPEHIRNDRELRRDFSPRPLMGLCDGELFWRDAARVADDREMLRAAARMGRC